MYWLIAKLNWNLNGKIIFSVAGVDNDDAISNNIVFTIKDTKLHAPVVFLSEKDNQKLSKIFSKEFET